MSKQFQTHIRSLAFGARGVGEVEGKICFVEGALPGEDVVFDIIKDTARYVEGKVVEVLKPSEDRTAPPCQYYGRCGGCQLQHLNYAKELDCKRQQVEDIFQRIGGKKNFTCDEIIPSPDSFHYRDTVTLHKSEGGYGFYSARSKEIIDISECLLATKAINEKLEEMPRIGRKDDVTLKSDHAGRVWASNRPGERFFLDKYNGKDIYLSPKAFSQTNRFIADKIAETLTEWIGFSGDGAVFFDVYCGTGFFSFLTERDFSLRIGMDENRIAIDCTKTTVKQFGLEKIKFYRGTVEEDFFNVFERAKGDHNIVFIDPSRAGVDKRFLCKLKDCKDIDKLYYLSCDPSKLARDMKMLIDDAVWSLGRVLPFDMFPRTRHIEVLAEFCRT